MVQPPGPKKKGTNQSAEDNVNDVKTTPSKKENKEEDVVPVDRDAQNYFDAEDENTELRSDDTRDIPL
jgi:hypothetical protein